MFSMFDIRETEKYLRRGRILMVPDGHKALVPPFVYHAKYHAVYQPDAREDYKEKVARMYVTANYGELVFESFMLESVYDRDLDYLLLDMIILEAIRWGDRLGADALVIVTLLEHICDLYLEHGFKVHKINRIIPPFTRAEEWRGVLDLKERRRGDGVSQQKGKSKSAGA